MKFSPQSDLTKYLPEVKQSQQYKRDSLYTKFSTIEQISKSLQIQKENFDQQIHSFNQRIASCNNQLIRTQTSNKELLEKISQFNLSLQRAFHTDTSNFGQEYPKIPLNQVFYDLKEKPPFQKMTQTDELRYLENKIEKAEKQCAKLFCLQNDKFQSFSVNLRQQFDKLERKTINFKEDSQNKETQIKIFIQQQALKNKIKSWEKSLNEKFSTKMLNLIQKVQNSM